MKFKLWMEQEFQIQEPYYRIVSNAMYGARAKELLGDDNAPGTYWTSRWDAILFMLRSLFLNTMSMRGIGQSDSNNVTIYQTNNAVMQPPPEEHKWAFNYAHDAGEMVLVKLMSPPKIIYQGSVCSSEIESMIDQSFKHEEPIDHSKNGVSAKLNGQQVWIFPDYKQKAIIVSKKDGWKFTPIRTLRSSQEFETFSKTLSAIDWNSDNGVGLMYFFKDMGWD